RRKNQRGRRSALGPLRHFGRNRHREGRAQAHGRATNFVGRRSQRGHSRRCHSCSYALIAPVTHFTPSKTPCFGWTNAKRGGPPGPRPTPTSACCWDLSMLEVAGPGGPLRTRGPPHSLVEGFHPIGWAASP